MLGRTVREEQGNMTLWLSSVSVYAEELIGAENTTESVRILPYVKCTLLQQTVLIVLSDFRPFILRSRITFVV